MAVPPIRTMQDLLEQLDGLGYSKKTLNQIRPRIKECERIYNTPLNRIPADLQTFEERWGTGRIGALAAGFKSHAGFVEWRRRVRAALTRAAGPGPGTPALLQEWGDLLVFVRAHGGVGDRLPPHLAESVGKVGEVASGENRTPRDLDREWIDTAAAKLKCDARRTFKNGLTSLNKLVARRAELPEIEHLLPAATLPQPARVKAAPSTWRRGARPEAATLWTEFDAFVAWKRGRDSFGRPIPADRSDFKERTAQTYEAALTKATGVLGNAGCLQDGDRPGLKDICNTDTIMRVAELWQARALDGEVRSDASTLHLDVERLSHIAEVYVGLGKKDRKKLRKIRRKIRKATPARQSMSPPRLAWIKRFARSPRQQRAVHFMPEQLIREVQPTLNSWNSLRKRRKRKQMMRALHLGIAATQAAILFRGSSVRAANLRGLTFRGAEAQLFLCAAGRDISLSIPAHLVKNEVEIESEFDADARPVIDWYLAQIRPRLVSDHPYGHNLADSDFLFPSMRADRAMEETTFADHYRRGVEAVGLDMSLHQARHITAYLILAEDPNALALAAAVLGDDTSTVEGHYAWIDGVKANKEARELLLQSRRKARKHRKGAFENA